MTNEYSISFEAIAPASLEALSHAFYEHFDGVLVERDGQVIVTVHVDGVDAVDAARTAIADLEDESTLGLSICHVDLDLVDGPEVGRRLGVTRQAVQNWAVGTRGQGFPRPLGCPGGKRIWAWGEVVAWARDRLGSQEAPTLTRDEAARVDALLAQRRNLTSATA